MKPELFDYEGRLFAIYEGSRGYLWKAGAWQPISVEFAGRVWASGVEAKAADFDANLESVPA